MQDLVGHGEGLREAKKRATRRQLTSTARRLSFEHGLDAVTVEMICAEVGVSVRTFFNYFVSKDDSVLGEAVPIGNDASRQVFRSGGPTGQLLPDLMTLLDPTEHIDAQGREEFARSFALFIREPRILALQLRRAFDHEQELAVLISQRRHLPAPDQSCKVAAAIAQTVLRCGLSEWVNADEDRPSRDHLLHAAESAATLLTSTVSA